MPPLALAARDDSQCATRRSIQPYRPRAAEHTVLHRIVRAHLATFLQTAEDAGGVPTFVEREFRQFLGCGVWARGFARFRCDACHAERLVPFSCKARAVCPSGGRRMAERAANLVDQVLPALPMRQWVLSLPFRLRYLLAWNHELCREVLAVYARALRGFLSPPRAPRRDPRRGDRRRHRDSALCERQDRRSVFPSINFEIASAYEFARGARTPPADFSALPGER